MVSAKNGTNDFVFPTQGSLPHHDPDAGISLGKSGIRGIFQAGVAHALVMCGYYPGVVAGTSGGSINGTVLALAGELSSQAERLSLVEANLDAWASAGERVFSELTRQDTPLRNLVRDLVDIDLPLEDLVALFDDSLVGRWAAKARLVLAVLRRDSRMRGGFFGGTRSAFLDYVASTDASPDSKMAFAQGLLDVYGLEHSLLSTSIIDSQFAAIIHRYAKKSSSTRFEDIEKTHLVFQVANMSRPRQGDRGTTRLETIGGSSGPDETGFSRATLLGALRAACAAAPLFPSVALREIIDPPPKDLAPTDRIMDAALVEKDPLSLVINHWSRLPPTPDNEKRRFRLFVVHLDPTGEVKYPSPPRPQSFFNPVIHSLMLLNKVDQRYPTKMISIVSQLVEALREKDKAVPAREDGGRFVVVHTSEIAPREVIPFLPLSAPSQKDLRGAAASGCRSTLEVLHARTIAALAEPGGSVECAKVLERARAAQQDTTARERYFSPVESLCAQCPGHLQSSHDHATISAAAATKAKIKAESSNDFKAFHHHVRSNRPGAKGKVEALTVMVPAGGVFLGVFQVGAIAALKRYKIFPDFYAGASVGTLFSYVLEACLQEKGSARLKKMVTAIETIPVWVDKVEGLANGQSGRVDVIGEELAKRWSHSPALIGLRGRRLREIVDALASDDDQPTPRDEAVRRDIMAGLDALLFTPIMSRTTRLARPLNPERHPALSWREIRTLIENLSRLRLHETVSLLDRVAENLDLFDPDGTSDGELLGFEGIAKVVRDVVFDPLTDPTLSQHSETRLAKFIFTVTNHSRGVLEHFGFNDEGQSPTPGSPNAVEACLAASSFPLAFRRRSRDEIFRHAPAENTPEDLYADGGILNNFPSDSAYAYLHALSSKENTRWLGDMPHRVLLLSLTFPMAPGPTDDNRLLFLTQRALAASEDEKVAKTMRGQDLVNLLAKIANPILQQRKDKEQGIRANMDLISPTYAIYPHSFAFKELLGFDVDKQREMLASGCRRARLAFEWRYHQEHPEGGTRPNVETFRTLVKQEVSRATSPWRFPRSRACIFGKLTPESREALASGNKAAEPRVCPFVEGDMSEVFERCKETVDRELNVPDLKLRLHVIH